MKYPCNDNIKFAYYTDKTLNRGIGNEFFPDNFFY